MNRTVGVFERSVLGAAALAGVTLLAQSASAHISLDDAGTHKSRTGGGFFDIKTAPCGIANAPRSANVYTYKPGSTITIELDEYVPHPGYFRIAFDDDGVDGFVTPVSITGESGDCFGDPKCGAGMEDYCNNDAVLLDNLDRHSSGGGTRSWTVTLPNVECDNCTLQVIQVMDDLDIHQAPYPEDDIYYQCIDLVLSNEATNESDAPMPIDGIDCKADAPMAGTGGMGGAGGESGMGGAGGMTGGAGGSTAGAGGGGAGGTAGAAGTGAGTGGATGGTGATTGGAGGAAGAAGTAGVGGAGGAGGAAGTVTPGGPTSSGDDGGCSATGAFTTTNALSGLLPLALALLFVRRRRG